MRFAWKMIALVAVLLALSLAIGGFWAVRSAFRSELDAAVTEAQEDMKLFSVTLQALCAQQSDGTDAKGAVQTALRRFPAPDREAYCVFAPDGSPLFAAGSPHDSRFAGVESDRCETAVEQKSGRYYLVTRQQLSLYGEDFGLERRRNVTEVFTRAQQNLNAYRLVMLVILLAGMGLTTALTLWMTRPIRRISRTAKQLSQGHYEKRAAVRSDDELGQLARDFNAMAEALEQKILELEDAARRQKEFTASFAHELKTPLTSVIGYADTMRSRILPQKQQMEAAGYIFSEGRRLEAMSIALLDLFALEDRPPRMERVHMRRLFQSVRESTRYLMERSGVRLELHCEDRELTAAPDLLQVLIYNLIDNARKASARGGTVSLSGHITEEGYQIRVRDHGTGIPAEALKRITEPFYMVDKSRARAQGGAGLGLALCQKIAELHGGRLEFESTLGEGTCASLILDPGGALT